MCTTDKDVGSASHAGAITCLCQLSYIATMSILKFGADLEIRTRTFWVEAKRAAVNTTPALVDDPGVEPGMLARRVYSPIEIHIYRHPIY